jgi:hypothetical protein
MLKNYEHLSELSLREAGEFMPLIVTKILLSKRCGVIIGAFLWCFNAGFELCSDVVGYYCERPNYYSQRNQID